LRWQALCVIEQKSRIRNETPVRQITAVGFVIIDWRQWEPPDVANPRWSRARFNFCANLLLALSLTASANYSPQRTARGAPPLGFAFGPAANLLVRITHFLLLLFCFVSVACSDRPVEQPKLAPIRPADQENRVSLRRMGCYGTCAMYTVVLWSDGRVFYEGREYVGKRGIAEARVSQEKFTQLSELIVSDGFFSFEDSYIKKCKVSDLPFAIITVKLGSKEKSVEFPAHCPADANADGLWEISKLIDAAANTSRWVKGTPEQEKSWVEYVQE
jgi:hypothetical protein